MGPEVCGAPEPRGARDAVDPEIGRFEEVTRVAAGHGFTRRQVVRMPANNLTVVFARSH